MLFINRLTRIGWAAANSADGKQLPFVPEKKRATAQVHVTFFCPLAIAPVTESKLRELFERFGNVLDVTINRADFHMEIAVHSGFGFIHYELDPEGVRSALMAIEYMNERMVDQISLGCTVSHGLETYMKNTSLLQHPPTMQDPLPHRSGRPTDVFPAPQSPRVVVGNYNHYSMTSPSSSNRTSSSSTTSLPSTSADGFLVSRSFEENYDVRNIPVSSPSHSHSYRRNNTHFNSSFSFVPPPPPSNSVFYHSRSQHNSHHPYHQNPLPINPNLNRF
jgi:hypothetical protein